MFFQNIPVADEDGKSLESTLKLFQTRFKEIKKSREITGKEFSDYGNSLIVYLKQKLKSGNFRITPDRDLSIKDEIIFIPRSILEHPFAEIFLFEAFCREHVACFGRPNLSGREIDPEVFLNGLNPVAREELAAAFEIAFEGQTVFASVINLIERKSPDEQLLFVYNLRALLYSVNGINAFKDVVTLEDIRQAFSAARDKAYVENLIWQSREALSFGLIEKARMTLKDKIMPERFNQVVPLRALLVNTLRVFSFLPQLKNGMEDEEIVFRAAREINAYQLVFRNIADVRKFINALDLKNSTHVTLFLLALHAYLLMINNKAEFSGYDRNRIVDSFLKYALDKSTEREALDEFIDALVQPYQGSNTQKVLIKEHVHADLGKVLARLLGQYKDYTRRLYERDVVSQNRESFKTGILEKIMDFDAFRAIFASKTWMLGASFVGGVTLAVFVGFIVRYILRPLYEGIIVMIRDRQLLGAGNPLVGGISLALDHIRPDMGLNEITRHYDIALATASFPERHNIFFRLYLLKNIFKRVNNYPRIKRVLEALFKYPDINASTGQAYTAYQEVTRQKENRLSFAEDMFLRAALNIEQKHSRLKRFVGNVAVSFIKIPLLVMRSLSRAFLMDNSARFFSRLINMINVRLGIIPRLEQRENFSYQRVDPDPAAVLTDDEIRKKEYVLNLIRNSGVEGAEKFADFIEQNFTIQFRNFIDRRWWPMLARPENVFQHNGDGYYRIDFNNKTIYLSAFSPAYMNALGLVKIGAFACNHQIIRGEKINIHLMSEDTRKFAKDFWKSLLYSTLRNGNTETSQKGSIFVDRIFHLLWITPRFFGDRVYSNTSRPGILTARKRMRPVKLVEEFKIGIYMLLFKNRILETGQQPFKPVEEGPRVSKAKALFYVSVPVVKQFAKFMMSISFFIALFGGIVISLDLGFLADWLHRIMDIFSQIPYIGWMIQYLWQGLISGYLFAKSIFENLILSFFKINIEDLRALIKQIGIWLEPVKVLVRDYITPFVYTFVFPAILFVVGMVYGGIIYKANLAKKVQKFFMLCLIGIAESARLTVKYVLDQGKNLADFLGLSIDEDNADQKITRFTDWIKTFVLRVLGPPFKFMSRIIIPLLTIVGTFSFIVILGSLAFPPLDLQYIIHCLHSLGIPVHPLMLFFVLTTVIGLPFAVLYNLADKIHKIFSARSAKLPKIIISGGFLLLFSLTVLLPGISSYVIKHNPGQMPAVSELKKTTILEWEDRLRRWIRDFDDFEWIRAFDDFELSSKEDVLKEIKGSQQLKAKEVNGQGKAAVGKGWKKFKDVFHRLLREQFRGNPDIDPYTGKLVYVGDTRKWILTNIPLIAEGIKIKNPAFYGNSVLIASLLIDYPFDLTSPDIDAKSFDIIMGHMLDIVEGKVILKPSTYREQFYFQAKAFEAVQYFVFRDTENMYVSFAYGENPVVLPYNPARQSPLDKNGVLFNRLQYNPSGVGFLTQDIYPKMYPVWEKSWKRFQNLPEKARDEFFRNAAFFRLAHIGLRTKDESLKKFTSFKGYSGREMPLLAAKFPTLDGIVHPLSGRIKNIKEYRVFVEVVLYVLGFNNVERATVKFSIKDVERITKDWGDFSDYIFKTYNARSFLQEIDKAKGIIRVQYDPSIEGPDLARIKDLLLANPELISFSSWENVDARTQAGSGTWILKFYDIVNNILKEQSFPDEDVKPIWEGLAKTCIEEDVIRRHQETRPFGFYLGAKMEELRKTIEDIKENNPRRFQSFVSSEKGAKLYQFLQGPRYPHNLNKPNYEFTPKLIKRNNRDFAQEKLIPISI